MLNFLSESIATNKNLNKNQNFILSFMECKARWEAHLTTMIDKTTTMIDYHFQTKKNLLILPDTPKKNNQAKKKKNKKTKKTQKQ